MASDSKGHEKTSEHDSDSSIHVLQLGVWRVFFVKEVALARWHRFKTVLPTVKQLTIDFSELAPVLFPLYSLAIIFLLVDGTILWHLFSRILLLVEIGLVEGRFDYVAIAFAVAARVAFAVLFTAVSCWSRKAECIVQNRIVHHVDGIMFEWKSNADLSVTEDYHNNHEELPSTHVWYAYRDLLTALGRALSIVGQLYYIATLVQTKKEALLHVFFFLGKPFTRHIFRHSLWEKSWIATSTDPNYNRMQSLNTIVSKPEYKQEIMTNGGTQYIIQEYRKARRLLGDACASYPAAQYSNQERIELRVLSELLGQLHMLYCLATAILSPSNFTFSRVVMFHNAGQMITAEFDAMLEDMNLVGNSLTSVTRMYDLAHTKNVLKDGHLVHSKLASNLGMALTMENVSFSYPGNKSDENALHDVSFSIRPGQLVVIVGANGCGKSTLVKLLTRLYDCDAGRVLVDGADIKTYKRESLHDATAVLTQDTHIYQLSLAENIGIGNPCAADDRMLIMEAARKGRADGFIEKCVEKYDTVIEPMVTNVMGAQCSETDDTPLTKIHQGFQKKSDVSGGERQRVAASRTFMRLTSDTVKLVVADEPSSNLDPEGEWELFKNLRDERQGRTMIFVSHRFGHLTKHADLILCMKNGRLIEKGTHDELMGKTENGEHGEYHKLYQIQARAFTEVL
ncbi:P-loop containing nucleoside triphosphate hydrolase protein [Mycena pura]|uniref:P-loop containing nucleoside triphosphate hydrolase protein n=1 Tax=Mycena pura TaxID=153505 RepID=A0AAD6VVB0_9AGAR|nr:P-loop containing nucleoside triphosphate hydrolase protein [Mycena pura]